MSIPTLGNNARLAEAIGLENPKPFFDWKGIKLGLRSHVDMGREELVRKVSRATGTAAHMCPGGPDPVQTIGVITGGAGAEVFAAAGEGIDTFITGEGPHWSYTAAEELGVNVIYGGHYATETFGVKALGDQLSEKFGVPWEFIDHPTGLVKPPHRVESATQQGLFEFGPALERSFFERDVLSCARELIGAIFRWNDCAGVVVETEAYSEHGDEACHTFFRPSARAFVESHDPGAAYVYMNYGMYWLTNVLVKNPETGERGFVLLRGLEPVSGFRKMRRRRNKDRERDLCSGPGKLSMALASPANIMEAP